MGASVEYLSAVEIEADFKDSLDNEVAQDVVIEKLCGLPKDVEMCRVVLSSGTSEFVTRFFSVNENGITPHWICTDLLSGGVSVGVAEIMQAIPQYLKNKSDPQQLNKFSDCQFQIQTRVWKDESYETQTIGCCQMDLNRFIETGKEDQIFCFPDGLRPFASVTIPYAQVTLRHRDSANNEMTVVTNEDIAKTSNPHNDASQEHSQPPQLELPQRLTMNKERKFASGNMAQRRAHYAANWTKRNSLRTNESHDLADKRLSMDTCESVDTLGAAKNMSEAHIGFVSATSLDDDRLSSDTSSPCHKTNTPITITARSAFTEAADPASEQEEYLRRKLEAENRKLKDTIAQLECDLMLSKSETQNANSRVSSLVTELALTKKRLQEDARYPRDRKDFLHNGRSLRGDVLIRQTSTNSDTLEASSKKSISSSARSSAKDVFVRSVSIPVKYDIGAAAVRPSQPPSATATAEALEEQKLAFAEKLVEKEELIAKLEKQVALCTTQLHQMEAGIDGVETRFDHELNNFKIQMSRKYQVIFQKGQDLINATKSADQNAEVIKKEMHKLANIISQDVRALEQTVQKKEQQRLRLGEEKRSIRRKFDAKTLETTDAENRARQLARQLDEERETSNELRYEIRQQQEKVAFLNDRLADLTINVDEPQASVAVQSEMDTLNNRISSLEEGLAEYESKNRKLIEDLDKAHTTINKLEAHEEVDMISKEKAELQQQINEVSEKLVDLEQENNALREESEQLSDTLAHHAELEENVTFLSKQKHELEAHLVRRKKHIEELQSELKELKLNVQNHQSDVGFDSCVSQESVSGQLEAVLLAEKRYGELEKFLTEIQSERDQLLEEKSSKMKMLQSLLKENKSLSASYKKQQKLNTKLTEKLEEAKTEIATLHESLYSRSSSRSSSAKSRYGEETDAEITQELVNAKVSLAENDERLITLRRDLHKSMARNAVLKAKTTRLETLIKELKEEKRGFITRKVTRTMCLSGHASD